MQIPRFAVRQVQILHLAAAVFTWRPQSLLGDILHLACNTTEQTELKWQLHGAKAWHFIPVIRVTV